MKKQPWFRSGISLPVTRLDPVSPTTSSDVVLLDTSKNNVEMSIPKNLNLHAGVAGRKERVVDDNDKGRRVWTSGRNGCAKGAME
ncbi:hypothetical protein C1H46_044467 [Malus baccata]|uniref:Uncharacterized protein n=1 Tax=Malus baccata TaxID=106549 RepID=A0A540K716_MALBA|nr:hypothetical protein C1H46_044467 [Malus baccata]